MVLDEEVSYYEAHREDLVREYEGSFVLIKGSHLEGTYDSLESALQAGRSRFGNVPMLIREVTRCDPDILIPIVTHGIR